jgi:hypothetical protein
VRACAALAALLLSGCSCGADHIRPVDANRPDGGPGTACVDLTTLTGPLAQPALPVAQVSDADWNCIDAPNRGESMACERALQGYSPAGRVFSFCGQNARCYSGDQCIYDRGSLNCTCGGVPCEPSQVCYLDDDATLRCATPCIRERTPPRLCDPMPRPVPTGVANVDDVTHPLECTAEQLHLCRLWYQSFAPPGTLAVANGCTPGGVANCVMGDLCTNDNPTSAWTCSCNGMTCAPTEVCVTDETGDPIPHCVPSCWAMP